MSYTTDVLEEHIKVLEDRLEKITWIINDYSIQDKINQIKEALVE